jgi:uncharacterized membrane protein YdbT with pleckstrin-like domain
MSLHTRLPGIHENPEDADWLHLADGETVRWTGRPSRYTIATALVSAFALAIGGLVLTAWLVSAGGGGDVPAWVGYLPLVLTAVGLVWGAMTYLDWIRLLYVITDEEIYVKHGLVSRDVTQVRLSRVQNTGYSQSTVERMLSYGDVEVFTAGTSTQDVVFESVPDPVRVTEILTTLLGEHDHGDSIR